MLFTNKGWELFRKLAEDEDTTIAELGERPFTNYNNQTEEGYLSQKEIEEMRERVSKRNLVRPCKTWYERILRHLDIYLPKRV